MNRNQTSRKRWPGDQSPRYSPKSGSVYMNIFYVSTRLQSGGENECKENYEKNKSASKTVRSRDKISSRLTRVHIFIRNGV